MSIADRLTDPCAALQIPPYSGIEGPAYKACKAAGGIVGGPIDKVNDIAAKDEHKTLSSLLREAGFSGRTKEGDDAIRAGLGIINAESGGNPGVKNPQPCSAKGDHAVGLMQICTPMHMSEADAKDPRKNLAKAHELYVACGNSFSCDWPTYHKGISGPDKTITVKHNTLTGQVTNAAGDALDATGLGVVRDLIEALFDPATYMRLGKGALGGILIVIGVGAIVLVVVGPVLGIAGKATSTIARTQRIAKAVGR